MSAGRPAAPGQPRASLRQRLIAGLSGVLITACGLGLGAGALAAATDEDPSALLQEAGRLKAAGRFADGAAAAQRAVELQEARHDPAGLAVALARLGDLRRASGQYAEAMRALTRAEGLFVQHGGPDDLQLAGVLNDKAEVFMLVRDLDGAAATAERALAIRRGRLPAEHIDIGSSIHNLARIHRARGDPARAIPLFDEALALTEKLRGPEHPNVAAVLNNYGLLLMATGDYGRARSMYDRSLRIRESHYGPDHPETATALNNLALFHGAVGAHDEALALFERVLAIDRRQLGEAHPDAVRTLHNIASAHVSRGDADAAWPLLQQSLALWRVGLGPDHPEVANALSMQGRLKLTQGEPAAAVALMEESVAMLERRLGPDHATTASKRTELALALMRDRQPRRAIAAVYRSLPVLERTATREALWRGQYVLSGAQAQLDRPELAVFWGKQAVATLQTVRRDLGTLDRSVQRGFVGEQRHIYADLVELLVAQGRLAEAQETLRLMKQDEYFEFILRDAGTDRSGAPITFSGPAELDAHAELRRLRQRLEGLARELAVLDRRARLGLDADEAARQQRLRSEQAEAGDDFDRFVGSLAQHFEAQPTAPAAVATAAAPPPAGVARLQYLVSERRVLILASTAQRRIARDVALPAADLARDVEALRRAIQSRADVRAPARRLHDALIAPVARELARQQVQRLELSLDGVLRYLPFAALHDGHSYLAERYATTVLVEAVATPRPDAAPPRWELDGFGLTRALPGYAALPGVRRELEQVRREVPAGELHFDEAFTRERLLGAIQRPRPLLHVASHYQFRPGTEIDSYLLLGDGSRLSLREFRLARADLRQVRLVALSACDTATGGGRDQSGREVEGLAAVLRDRGARAVLATLWPIGDAGSAELLPRLYRLHLREGLPLAQALQQVQGDALPRTGRGGAAGPAGELAHPFYWAGFVLLGAGD